MLCIDYCFFYVQATCFLSYVCRFVSCILHAVSLFWCTFFCMNILLTYLLTYFLTPRCRVFLEKLTGLQLVKKFPAFHENRRFITAPTSVRHLSQACECFQTEFFYREGLLAPRPTLKLEDHPLSAVRDCLFNIFAATLLIGGHSSIRKLRTRLAVVTGTHYIFVRTSKVFMIAFHNSTFFKFCFESPPS